MAIKTPTLSPDDQEYYPLHEEDDVPETPDHESAVRYARDAVEAHFPDWFVTGNVCVYWERGNTRDYRAPDLFVVKDPLAEPVTRVYLLWQQPPIAFALEVGNRTTFRQDVGPKVELYQEKIKAVEYGHVDLDRGVQRLWRLGPGGYDEQAPEPNGRLRSRELDLEFGLDADGFLRFYTMDGQRLLTHGESEERRQAAEQQMAGEAQRRHAAEQQAAQEAQRRQAAEVRAREAETRAAAEAAQRAELERQIAELRARLGDPE